MSEQEDRDWLTVGARGYLVSEFVFRHEDGSECLWSVTDQQWYQMHPLYPTRECGREHGPLREGQPPKVGRAMSEARWSRGWRIGPKSADVLRHAWCLIVGHDWQINHRETQRACLRCWWCQNRTTPTDQPEEVRCGGEEESDV